MPSLKRYADSAAQPGSYVLANVGGDTLVTLQVSGLADRLFGLLDYHPPDTIPRSWRLYCEISAKPSVQW